MIYEQLLINLLGVKLIKNNMSQLRVNCINMNLNERITYHHLLSKFSTLSSYTLINTSSFRLEKIQGTSGVYVELQMNNSDTMTLKL